MSTLFPTSLILFFSLIFDFKYNVFTKAKTGLLGGLEQVKYKMNQEQLVLLESPKEMHNELSTWKEAKKPA